MSRHGCRPKRPEYKGKASAIQYAQSHGEIALDAPSFCLHFLKQHIDSSEFIYSPPLQNSNCAYEQNRGILTSSGDNADTGSVPLSAETNGATFQQADVSHGTQNTKEEPSLEKLPEVRVTGSESVLVASKIISCLRAL